MRKTVSAAVFAAAYIATPALAQDAPAASGPRIEATVGWDDVVLGLDGERGAKSGVTYGGEIGYDIQTRGGLVIGVYAGIDGASTKECVADGTERFCLKAGRNITAGARVGARVGGRALVYGKGGYSNGRLTGEYTDSAFPADNARDGDNADGFHLGAGVELGLSRGFYGKLEYNYTRYSIGGDDADFDVDLERHRIVGGVGYHF